MYSSYLINEAYQVLFMSIMAIVISDLQSSTQITVSLGSLSQEAIVVSVRSPKVRNISLFLLNTKKEAIRGRGVADEDFTFGPIFQG